MITITIMIIITDLFIQLYMTMIRCAFLIYKYEKLNRLSISY